MLFKRNKEQKFYDPIEKKPVIKSSICTGEQVAGFLNLKTGAFEDVMLIQNQMDIENFKRIYGINDEMEKIY